MSEFKVSHLYYTISRKRDGEGVFDCSKTLNETEKSEIQKTVVVGYEPPINILINPTHEDIAQPPQNYAYYKLKTYRKQALLLSTYTGWCNHTPDRPGNFLTHIILFDESIEKINLPALMKNLPFKTQLTIEEEENFEIDAPQLTIDIEESRNVFFQNSISFLSADANRKRAFRKITDKIVTGWLNMENRRIVVKASQAEVKDFIFALYSILPSSLINQYSFATYKSTLRDSPFQIVGILSDASVIVRDNNDYLVDLSQPIEDYTTKNEFTDVIFEIINKENPENTEIYFSGYDLEGKNQSQLNNVVKTIRFKVNVENETQPTLKGILNVEQDSQKRKELIDFVIQRNPDLFLEYILLIIKEEVTTVSSVESKINVLFGYFKKHFRGNETLSQEFYKKIYFPLTTEEAEKGELAYFLFMKFEIFQILKGDEIEDELRWINDFFDKKQEQEYETNMKLISFLKKYIGIISDKVPFLYRKKIKYELQNRIKEGAIELTEIAEKISDLTDEDDRFQIIAAYLYALRKNGKFDLSFGSYLSEIEDCCNKDKNRFNAFWEYFFSKKEDYFQESYVLRLSISYSSSKEDCLRDPRSYLKRLFVIAVLEKENYQDVISKLKFVEYEEKWLIEHFIEAGQPDKLEHCNFLPVHKYPSWKNH